MVDEGRSGDQPNNFEIRSQGDIWTQHDLTSQKMMIQRRFGKKKRTKGSKTIKGENPRSELQSTKPRNKDQKALRRLR